MHSKRLWLVGMVVLAGCLDTHERDNPLDQNGAEWDPPVLALPQNYNLKAHDPDTLVIQCEAHDRGRVVRYFLQCDEPEFADTSESGFFSVAVGSENRYCSYTAEDDDGSLAVSEYGFSIHRNHIPVVDSALVFAAWTAMDWKTSQGQALIRLKASDPDGVELDYRVDLDGKKGVWKSVNPLLEGFEDTIPLQYGKDVAYRILLRDPMLDSLVLEGVLTGQDSILPCTALGDTVFHDPRNDREYSCAWIGGEGWMTQNLDYGLVVAAAGAQSDDSQVERYCPGDSLEGCIESGAYYQWAEAVGKPYSCNRNATCALDVSAPQGICPDGWHVPTKAEWQSLEEALENGEAPTIFANTANIGFVNLDGLIQDQDTMSYFWTSTTDLDASALDKSISVNFAKGSLDFAFQMQQRKHGLSVRCVLD